MIVTLILNADFLDLPRLERALGRLRLFNINVDVNEMLYELFVILIGIYTFTNMEVKYSEGLSVTIAEMMTNDEDVDDGFFNHYTELDEYIEFFKNNIEVKTALEDLRNNLNGDYSVIESRLDIIKNRILIRVVLEE